MGRLKGVKPGGGIPSAAAYTLGITEQAKARGRVNPKEVPAYKSSRRFALMNEHDTLHEHEVSRMHDEGCPNDIHHVRTSADAPAKCKKHPRYKAIRRPKVACEDCRAIYTAKHPEEAK